LRSLESGSCINTRFGLLQQHTQDHQLVIDPIDKIASFIAVGLGLLEIANELHDSLNMYRRQ
jgi:hypothetical protein